MLTLTTLLTFFLISLGLVLTPGPNMIYLVSRALSQGWRAAAISLLGTAAGFVVYAVCAALGLTAIALAVPLLYDIIKYAGAAYLLWLAWQSLRPSGASPFVTRELTPQGKRQLFVIGLVTNLLNPKIALFYMSLLPQFVDEQAGSVLFQHLVLAVVQIGTSISVNFMLILGAGSIAGFLARHPLWLAVQRYFMGFVLAGLALRLATDKR